MKLLTVPSTEQVVATADGELRKIDAHLCIHFDANGRETRFTHQDMDLYDVREVCRQIELYCLLHLTSPSFREDAEQPDLGLEQHSGLCIRYDHWTRQVKYTRMGLDYHDAAIACAQVVAMCDHLLMHQIGALDQAAQEE